MFLRHPALRHVLAAALTASLAVPAAAASGTKSKPKKEAPAVGSVLEGTIVGSDGKPIRGAIVTVRSLDVASSWSGVPSDKRGRFRLKGLHYGWAELSVATPAGEFLGDQAMNLPPGRQVTVKLALLETRDKPASWWTDRQVEPPSNVAPDQIAGMVQSSQKLTGVEYWKSPAGIAILVAAGVVALGAIAAGGSSYRQPSGSN